MHRRRLLLISFLLVVAVAAGGVGVLALRSHRGTAPSASAPRHNPSPKSSPSATPQPSPTPPPTPAPLVQPVADLHVAPVDVPLRLRVPSIGVDAAVAAVGLAKNGNMDAPFGPADSPVWQEGFWYRGGAEPGSSGTATIAGHVDDTLGRPGAFARMRSLGVGDEVDVVDERSGATARFRIVEADNYPLSQANQPAILARIFGADAAAGRAPSTPTDPASRLTLITCAGTWRGSAAGYDHRLVDYAVRFA